MKKIIIFTLCTVFLSPLSIAHAQAPVESEVAQGVPSRQNILRERIEQQRTNYRQNLQEARDIAQQYRTAENEEDRDKLREQTRNGFLVRLTSIVDRMIQMQERIETRIATAQEQGLNVSEATQNLEQSKEATKRVLDNQEKLKMILENSTDPKNQETRKEAQIVFEVIKTDFTTARTHLVMSIQNLQNLMNPNTSATENAVTEEPTPLETIDTN